MSDSAEIAKMRLHFICAYDRQRADGRQRIAKFGPGNHRLLFDQVISVCPDEELLLEFDSTTSADEGYAIVIRRSP